MKKTLLPAIYCLLLFSVTAVQARSREPYKPKHELTVRWGLYDSEVFDSNWNWEWSDESPLERYNKGRYYCDDKLYTQAVSLSCTHEIKRWLAMSLNLSYSGVSQNERLTESDLIVNTYRKHRFAVFPSVKFTYFNRPMIRLYSAAGFGFGLKREKSSGSSDYYTNKTRVGGQLTFFGVSVGKDLFASWELGYGSMGFLTICGGYRF
jgi:hypothetical protein